MVLTEHESKIAYIASMANRYDYGDYKRFCISSGFEVMSFSLYARFIEYELYPEENAVSPSVVANCCGGGQVR